MRNVTTVLGSAFGFAFIQFCILLIAAGGNITEAVKEPGFAGLIYGSGAVFGAIIGGLGLLSTKVFGKQASPLAFRLSTASASIALAFGLNIWAAYTQTAASNGSILAIIYNTTTLITVAPLATLGLPPIAVVLIGAALVGWLVGAAGWYTARLFHGKPAA